MMQNKFSTYFKWMFELKAIITKTSQDGTDSMKKMSTTLHLIPASCWLLWFLYSLNTVLYIFKLDQSSQGFNSRSVKILIYVTCTGTSISSKNNLLSHGLADRLGKLDSHKTCLLVDEVELIAHNTYNYHVFFSWLELLYVCIKISIQTMPVTVVLNK